MNVEDLQDASREETNRLVLVNVIKDLLKLYENDGTTASGNYDICISEDGKSIYIPNANTEKPSLTIPFSDLEDAINVIVNAVVEGTERGQVLMPTATGKTIVMAEAIRILVDHDMVPQNSFVMTGSTIELSAQHIETLKHHIGASDINSKFSRTKLLLVCSDSELRKDVSENGDDYLQIVTTNPEEVANHISVWEETNTPYVIVSTYHSLEKVVGGAYKLLGDTPLNITFYDEAHNTTNKGFQSTVGDKEIDGDEVTFITDTPNYRSDFRFFLTATPRHTKKYDKDLDKYLGTRDIGMDNPELYGEVLYEMTPKEAIDKGMIIPPRILISKTKQGYEKFIEQYSNNYEALSEELVLEAALMENGIRSVYDDAGRVKMIVYARNVEHAKKLYDNVNWKGLLGIDNLNTYLIHSGTPTAERHEHKKGFKDSENALMFNFRIFGEGINIEDVNSIMLLRALEEAQTLAQAIGRALRLDPRDRAAIKQGDIQPWIDDGWFKPCGYVVIPETFGRSRQKGDVVSRLEKMLARLYTIGYQDAMLMGYRKEYSGTGDGKQQGQNDYSRYDQDYDDENARKNVGDVVEMDIFSRHELDEKDWEEVSQIHGDDHDY